MYIYYYSCSTGIMWASLSPPTGPHIHFPISGLYALFDNVSYRYLLAHWRLKEAPPPLTTSGQLHSWFGCVCCMLCYLLCASSVLLFLHSACWGMKNMCVFAVSVVNVCVKHTI